MENRGEYMLEKKKERVGGGGGVEVEVVFL